MSDLTADTRPCATCQKPATYAGTQDRLRVFVCEDKHLTLVRPV